MPKVSVILTSYNHAEYIEQAIESALNQTFSDFELIIIDDCSQDDSWDRITKHTDDRIIAIRNEKNLRSGNIYRCLPRCRGEYIAVHHSDDIWEPDKLRQQVEYLDAHPEPGACFTLVQLIDEDGVNYTPSEGKFYHNRFDEENRSRTEWLRYFFDEGNCLCHPSILIRKELYDSCGLFVYGLAQIPDFCMWIRLCLKREIHILQHKLTKFRLHTRDESNTSGFRPDTVIRSSNEYYLLFKEFEKITQKDDFFAVFPEAAEFYETDYFCASFLLARVLMTTNMPQKILCGMELLYRLLNDREESAQLEAHYQYTFRDFFRETAEFDVFTGMSAWREIRPSLFVDYGDGFSVENQIILPTCISQNGKLSVKFDIGVLSPDLSVKGLRFDPDEGRFWEIRLDSVLIDSWETDATADNAALQRDNYDVFFTADPIYSLSCVPESCRVIEIRGEMRGIQPESMEEIEAERYRTRELRNAYDNLQIQVDDLQTQNHTLHLQNDSLQAQVNGLQIQVDGLQIVNGGLREQVDGSQTQLLSFEALRDELLAQISLIEKENEDILSENASLNSQREELQTVLDNIRNSRLLRMVSNFTKANQYFH